MANEIVSSWNWNTRFDLHGAVMGHASKTSDMFRTVIVVFVFCYLISTHTESSPADGGLGSACEEDTQCSKMGELAVCVNYQCYCKQGAIPVNGICQIKKYIGEDCTSNEECQHVKKSACRDKICACVDGSVPNIEATSCLPLMKNFWSPCVEDVQCHKSFGEGSRCLTKCVCKNEYHSYNDSACIQNKGLGEECSSDYDCYLETDLHGTTISCRTGVCTCNSGYHSSSDNFECERDTGGSVSHTPRSCLVQILIATFVFYLKLILH